LAFKVSRFCAGISFSDNIFWLPLVPAALVLSEDCCSLQSVVWMKCYSTRHK